MGSSMVSENATLGKHEIVRCVAGPKWTGDMHENPSTGPVSPLTRGVKNPQVVIPFPLNSAPRKVREEWEYNILVVSDKRWPS